MTRDQVRTAVYSKVQFYTESGGSMAITGSTKPLRDLNGFDSMNGAEVCTALETSLGCSIPPKAEIFGTTSQPNTMDEIVKRVCAIVGAEGD